MKLKVENITKKFGTTIVLEDVSLNVNKNEIVAILGKSGCGKSTLLNIIAGFDIPDSGEILKDRKSIIGKINNSAYMFQEDLLLEHLNILENVTLPLKLKKKTGEYTKEEIKKLFEQFEIDGYEKFYPCELSGGMRQRVAFLRTYLCGEDLYLFDEPFSKLDNITKRELRKWFLKMWSEIDAAAIFITHDVDEAIELADKIVILSNKPAKILEIIKVTERAKKELSQENIELKRKIMEFYKV